MDEHRLLAGLMDKHTNVHVHTLAFERGLDRENGREMALNRLRAYSESMGTHALPRQVARQLGWSCVKKAGPTTAPVS